MSSLTYKTNWLPSHRSFNSHLTCSNRLLYKYLNYQGFAELWAYVYWTQSKTVKEQDCIVCILKSTDNIMCFVSLKPRTILYGLYFNQRTILYGLYFNQRTIFCVVCILKSMGNIMWFVSYINEQCYMWFVSLNPWAILHVVCILKSMDNIMYGLYP